MPVISYGIACCRKGTNGQYELLMIKKRCTYAFSEFVRGIYDVNNKQNLIHLFENMTIDEKILINTNLFDNLWVRNYGELPERDKNGYNKAVKRFNALIKINNGKYLREIIDSSSNVELLWEIPKGRIDRRETELEAAIREFKEETNISKSQYRILFDEGQISYSFIDGGVRYTYIYYIAIINNNRTNPKFCYNSEHMPREVGNIKFLSTDKIKMLNNNRLHKICKIIIKKVKKYI